VIETGRADRRLEQEPGGTAEDQTEDGGSAGQPLAIGGPWRLARVRREGARERRRPGALSGAAATAAGRGGRAVGRARGAQRPRRRLAAG
jgi:hypothetical protein